MAKTKPRRSVRLRDKTPNTVAASNHSADDLIVGTSATEWSKAATAKRNAPSIPTIPKTTAKAIDKKKKAARKLSQRRTCAWCADDKTERSFPSASLGLCEHMGSVCKKCVGTWLETKMGLRDFGEMEVRCADRCGWVAEHMVLKKMITAVTFERWDVAITNHLLTSSPDFIACLNPECGIHFSVGGCASKKKIECPGCKFELCLRCTRPWHAKKSCEQAKGAGEKESETMLAKLSKPCPNCSANIEKTQGCDHMHCTQCGHHFCYDCLGPYIPRAVHKPGCRSGGPLVDAVLNGDWIAVAVPGPLLGELMDP